MALLDPQDSSQTIADGVYLVAEYFVDRHIQKFREYKAIRGRSPRT